MTNWWINNRGEQFGPVPEDMVLLLWQTGRIAPDAQACADGTERWLPLSHVPAIAAYIHRVQYVGQAERKKPIPPIMVWTMIAGVVVMVVGLGLGSLHPRQQHTEGYGPKKNAPPPEPLPDLDKPKPNAQPKAVATVESDGCKPISPGLITAACKDAVRKQLLSPSTAKFPWMPPTPVKVTGSCTWQLASYVDAKNAFGVAIRYDYVCAVDPVADTVKATLLSP